MSIMESFKNKCLSLDVIEPKYLGGFVFLSFVCYFLQSLGMATPYWVKYDVGSSLATVGYFYGIWSECSTTTSGPTACVTWDSGSVTDIFRAAQAFELLAFIFQTGAEVGMVIFAFHDSKKFHKVIAVVIGSLFLVSSVMTFLGAILFSSDKSVEGSFSWAFGLSLFGGITSVPFGIFFVYIFFITKQREDNYKKTPRVKFTFVKNTKLKF